MTTATKLRLLSRDDILGADDRASEVVDVPEWGGSVRVRALSGAERDDYMSSLYTLQPNGQGGMEISSVNLKGSAVRLMALTVIDDHGARLFTEEDVRALSEKNGAALDRVETVAKRLSRLNKTLEQVKADLGAAQNGSTGIG